MWIIGSIFCLTGCATSHTSAEKVSPWDLWSGDRLQQHLAERKLALDALRARVNKLAIDISQKTDELGALKRDMDAANADSAAADRTLQKTREDIQIRSAELSDIQRNILLLQEQIAHSERNLQSGKYTPTTDSTEVQKHREEISRLESEVALLGRSIDRILLVRAKHGLQTK